MPDNSPKYIEDFRSTTPDVSNGNSPTGDPDPEIDWWPAFARASVSNLSTDLSDSLRKQTGIAIAVYVGRSRTIYKLSQSLPVFVSLIGIIPQVRLQFNKDTDGLFVHYPDTQWDPDTSSYRTIGTFHQSFSHVPRELELWSGYGTGGIVLRTLRLLGRSATGTCGIVVYRSCHIDNCTVQNFGWHGIYISADVNRSPGTSNANRASLSNIQVYSCGWFPGRDEAGGRYDQPWNRNRLRPFGSALRIEGGDANLIVTTAFNGTHNAHAAIHDSGFLGNSHYIPHCNVGHERAGAGQGGYILEAEYAGVCHSVKQYLENPPVGHDPQEFERARRDAREFEFFDYSIGERVRVAFVSNNPNARTKFEMPYVEGSYSHPDKAPVIQAVKPAFVEMGIGGRDWTGTTRQTSRGFEGPVQFSSAHSSKKEDKVILSEANGTFLTLSSNGDGPGHPYRIRYTHFLEDDINNHKTEYEREEDGDVSSSVESSNLEIWAGFYSFDRSNSQTAFAFTSSNSYQKFNDRKIRLRDTTEGLKSRKLEPGKLVLREHYRLAGWNKFGKVEYGSQQSLTDIEARRPASEREIGDTYICIRPH